MFDTRSEELSDAFVSAGFKIYLAVEPVEMRKQFNGFMPHVA